MVLGAGVVEGGAVMDSSGILAARADLVSVLRYTTRSFGVVCRGAAASKDFSSCLFGAEI